MSAGERIPIFAVIWSATALAAIFLVGGEPIGPFTVPIIAIIFGTALVSTALATRGMGGVSRREIRRVVEQVLDERESMGKGKRSANPKMDAFMKSLSPEEMDDLRARLEANAPHDLDDMTIGEDGELIRRSRR